MSIRDGVPAEKVDNFYHVRNELSKLATTQEGLNNADLTGELGSLEKYMTNLAMRSLLF